MLTCDNCKREVKKLVIIANKFGCYQCLEAPKYSNTNLGTTYCNDGETRVTHADYMRITTSKRGQDGERRPAKQWRSIADGD